MARDAAGFIVVKEESIPAPVGEVWRHLTDGRLLTGWFADTEGLRPGGEFVFSFGDGDFFSGQVVEWDAPHALHLRWRFMGVGPTYDISYSLSEADGATRLTVRDEGALTRDEADSLAEGWKDFLARLERRVRTNEPTRYLWSETIGCSVFLGQHDPAAAETFQNQDWWRVNFPEARVSPDAARDNAAKFDLRDEAWDGAATTVAVTIRQLNGAAYAEINHAGWTALAPDRQVAERRRYARLWAQALRQLERDAERKNN